MEVSKKKHSSKERWLAFILGIIIGLMGTAVPGYGSLAFALFAGLLFARALDIF